MANNEILLGAHISISGGLNKAIDRGEAIGCTAIQIFTKSTRSWFGKKLKVEDIKKFKEKNKTSNIKKVIAHSAYIINIGSKNNDTVKKSIKSLIHELQRCEQLGIPYLVLHPGSHLGTGEEKCIKKISKNIDIALNKVHGKIMILLENVAGQGTNVGYTFEQLKKIKNLCKEKKRIGICLDTCHAFAAGYPINTKKGYKETIKQFIKILGIRSLKTIHLNDSKMELGSRKDRHANIGKGKIPLATFKLIMNDPKLKNIPKILETPVQNESEYKKEIQLLRKMIK